MLPTELLYHELANQQSSPDQTVFVLTSATLPHPNAGAGHRQYTLLGSVVQHKESAIHLYSTSSPTREDTTAVTYSGINPKAGSHELMLELMRIVVAHQLGPRDAQPASGGGGAGGGEQGGASSVEEELEKGVEEKEDKAVEEVQKEGEESDDGRGHSATVKIHKPILRARVPREPREEDENSKSKADLKKLCESPSDEDGFKLHVVANKWLEIKMQSTLQHWGLRVAKEDVRCFVSITESYLKGAHHVVQPRAVFPILFQSGGSGVKRRQLVFGGQCVMRVGKKCTPPLMFAGALLVDAGTAYAITTAVTPKKQRKPSRRLPKFRLHPLSSIVWDSSSLPTDESTAFLMEMYSQFPGFEANIAPPPERDESLLQEEEEESERDDTDVLEQEQELARINGGKAGSRSQQRGKPSVSKKRARGSGTGDDVADLSDSEEPGRTNKGSRRRKSGHTPSPAATPESLGSKKKRGRGSGLGDVVVDFCSGEEEDEELEEEGLGRSSKGAKAARISTSGHTAPSTATPQLQKKRSRGQYGNRAERPDVFLSPSSSSTVTSAPASSTFTASSVGEEGGGLSGTGVTLAFLQDTRMVSEIRHPTHPASMTSSRS